MTRRTIYILVLMMFFACSKQKGDEQLITQTLESYYKAINKKSYRDLEHLLSPNMKQELSNIKDYGKEMVVFTSFKVTNIDIYSERAKAVVTAEDEFGNTNSLVWNLIKINGEWKMNNYNTSKASPINL